MVTDSTSSNILARSRNIYDRLDALERTARQKMNTFLIIFSICGVGIGLHEPIAAWISGKRNLPSPSLTSSFVGLIIIVAGATFSIWSSKRLNGVILLHKSYCSSESLIVETEQIYGHTYNSVVRLDYTQISQVSTKREHSPLAGIQPGFSLEVLEIKDKEGKVYRFLSFANSSELQTCIERYITT